MRERQPFFDVLRDRNICGRAANEKVSRKHQQQIGPTANPGDFARLTSNTLAKTPCLKVAGANLPIGLMQEKPVGANRLITMVLHDRRPPPQKAKEQRSERRACHVNDIRAADQPPQLRKARLPHRPEWERAIVEPLRRSLRDERDFKFRDSRHVAKFAEASRQRKNDGLHAADARCKKMRIDQQPDTRTLDGLAPSKFTVGTRQT